MNDKELEPAKEQDSPAAPAGAPVNQLAETYAMMRRHHTPGMIFRLFLFGFIGFWMLFAMISLMVLLIFTALESFYDIREIWKEQALEVTLVAAAAMTLWLIQKRRLPGFRTIRCRHCYFYNPLGRTDCQNCGEKL